jgi:hypothetical protein
MPATAMVLTSPILEKMRVVSFMCFPAGSLILV